MARSNYIYVVVNKEYEPVNTFTVKHECITWLNSTKMSGLNKVLRFKDSAQVPSEVEFNIEDFK